MQKEKRHRVKYVPLKMTSVQASHPHLEMTIETDTFLKAIVQGRLWIVEKMIDNPNVDYHFSNEEPLRLSVLYGRRGITELLLKKGANPVFTGKEKIPLLILACRREYATIVKLLVKYGASHQEEAVLECVERSSSACLNRLAESGVNISFNNDAPLLKAYYLHKRFIMERLLHYGANINAREGEILSHACRLGETSMVTFLLEKGADPNANESNPIRQAAQHHHTVLVELLLNNGADDSYLDDMVLDFYTNQVVLNWRKNNRLLRLRRAIRNANDNDIFKWQKFCRKSDRDNHSQLMQQAKLFDCDDVTVTSKRQVCAYLAKKMEDLIQVDNTLEGYDLYGNALSELPKWKLYKIYGRVYNIFDLIRLARNNYYNCPYTRMPLPVRDIEERRRWLEKTLTRNAYSDYNLLELVRDMPILSKEEELRTMLMNEVWTRLVYPPSMDVVIKASDETIEDMVRKLYLIANDILMYPTLSITRKWNIQRETGIKKKELFVHTIVEIARTNDSYQSTRHQTLNILFQHYREDGTTREGMPDDLLSFMIEQETMSSGSSSLNSSGSDSPPSTVVYPRTGVPTWYNESSRGPDSDDDMPF